MLPPLFSQDEVDAAHRREAARNPSLRATTAGEVRDWLAGQEDVADAALYPGSPGVIAVRLAGGLLVAVTISTGEELPAPTAPDDTVHALTERIRTWLAGEHGIDQAWAIPSRPAALGAELVDGTMFTIALTLRA
jgi:hypothetical protein